MKKTKSRSKTSSRASSKNGVRPATASLPQERTYSIPDYRLEKPSFTVRQTRKGDECCYEISGDLSAPVPPIRDSRYLSKKQCLEIYRWMLLNRLMEQALENLYKQTKVVGGVYFGLGQEACSCASAYALGRDDWFAPMIRNQGAQLVRGFHSRDIMMQYMAKAGSPTKGKDGTSHYGAIEKRHMVSPISMLGDLLPVMAGVSLGARLQGKELACLTWIGDGGQSTGVSYEGINFAAVRKLGLVLIIESNLWAYSTPTEYQVNVKDLANRAIGYGMPGVIIDGFQKYLLEKKWLTPAQDKEMIAGVEKEIDAEREFAENSPMPEGHTAAEGVFCDGCHEIKPKYDMPQKARRSEGKLKESEAAI